MDDQVDLSGLPEGVADAVRVLVGSASGDLAARSREELGDLIQAAQTVQGFADAASLDATQALVQDVVADHGVPADDPRYATRLRAHRRQAGQAVVHEVQLLTGSTLTGARDRVRFATALHVRTGVARDRLRAGECTWERARVAFTETAHLDPVLAGEVIDRLLLAPPERTHDESSIPLSHNGFRTRLRRQLALVAPAAAEAKRRHTDAVAARDTVTFPDHHGVATLQVSGDTARVCTAQQRITTLARAARAAGDERTLAQLRATTGTVIDAANTYRVPADLARLVAGRDHTCRAPGDCAHPATGCDLDHDTPHVPGVSTPAAGATHPGNLHALHRGHHNTKTGRFWSSTQHDDASITWATLTRQVTTTAYDHHRATDHAPPRPSRAERILGKHLAPHHENTLLPNVFTDLADHQLAATPMRSCPAPHPPPPF